MIRLTVGTMIGIDHRDGAVEVVEGTASIEMAEEAVMSIDCGGGRGTGFMRAEIEWITTVWMTMWEDTMTSGSFSIHRADAAGLGMMERVSFLMVRISRNGSDFYE